MRFYAIDVGYGWTKFCVGECADGTVSVRTGKFPTAFALLNDAVRLDEHVPHHVHRGLRYLCGEDAVRSSSGFSVRDIETMLQYVPVAVAEVFRRTNLADSDVELAMGLPPADYRTHRERLRGLAGEVLLLGKGMVRPQRIEIYPQGAAAKVEVDLNGGLQRGLLMDVGHNTTDIVAVVDGRVLPNDVMTISGGGLARATGEFSDYVRFAHGLTFATAQEAYDVMCRGYCHSFGRRIEFNGELDRIVRGYVEWLLAKVRERWEERLRLAEAVVVFGGGAKLVLDHFPEALRGMVRVLPDPEFANARAYMLLLAKKHGAKVVFDGQK